MASVNCTPIKPQVSFGCEECNSRNYIENIDRVDEFQKTHVKSDDIKSPLAIGISVAASAAGIYAVGKGSGAVFSKIFKSAPQKLEGALKKGSQMVQNKAKSLSSADVTPGKLKKAKEITGKVLAKTEELARNGYKKIAYSGIPKDVANPERANRAFQNAAGAAAVASVVPQILKKDSNDDGVKDIVQKSQNAYTGAKSSLADISALGEIVSALT